MKLIEAKEKLRNLAGPDAYISMSYEVTQYRDNESEVECSVYVSDYNYYKGKTWEEALLKLEYVMYPERKPIPEVEDL